MHQLKLRQRTRFLKSQIDTLEQAFKKNAFPDVLERTTIGKSIGVKMQQVTVWFQNRRMKAKRETMQSIFDQSSSIDLSVRSAEATKPNVQI